MNLAAHHGLNVREDEIEDLLNDRQYSKMRALSPMDAISYNAKRELPTVLPCSRYGEDSAGTNRDHPSMDSDSKQS